MVSPKPSMSSGSHTEVQRKNRRSTSGQNWSNLDASAGAEHSKLF
jgi:hypothetical protein